MTHVVGFSGGKDSTALLLWMRDQGLTHETVFNDTGWEHPLTYEYIDEQDEATLDLFGETPAGTSVYNLCE